MKKLVRIIAVMLMVSLMFWGLGDDVSAAKSKGPKIKTIIATQTYVKIEWGKAKKAKKYCVFKKTGNGSYKMIAELGSKARSYTDKKIKIGTTYKYRIAAKKGKKLRYGKEKQITPRYVAPCKLKSLSNYYGSTKNRYSIITWTGSKSSCYYYILRKSGSGSYSHIGTVKGVNGTQTYKDKTISDGTNYTYTVRAVQKGKKKKKKKTTVEYWSSYDTAGIRTICQKANVDGSISNFQNLKMFVKWKAVSGATHYCVYRKKGFNGKYKLLATVKSGTTQYIDVYSKSLKTADEKKNLFSEHFVDPDRNPYHYMVRAVYSKNGKTSYGDYYLHGVFSLSQPQIMAVTKVNGSEYKVKFCEVFNAENYEIYSGTKSSGKYTWHKLKTVKPKGKNSQTVTVKKHSKDTYFTVKAVSTLKGKKIKSTYETGFTIKNLGKLKGKKILYYGDSITYGSGYGGIYAYPIRVQQMLGGDYYNPSIPGATYTQKTAARFNRHPSTKRDRMYDQVGVRIRDGKDVIKSFNNTVHIPIQPSWGRTFDKYDVVIFAAGTNDYLDNAEIGDLNSSDPHTFCGAINMTMKFIQDGNAKRVSAGKAPIKVIFLNQFYSDRTYYKNWGKRTNRFKTKNDIGLTLTDYQKAQDALVAKYQRGYIFEPDSDTVGSAGAEAEDKDAAVKVKKSEGQTMPATVPEEETAPAEEPAPENIAENASEEGVTETEEPAVTDETEALEILEAPAGSDAFAEEETESTENGEAAGGVAEEGEEAQPEGTDGADVNGETEATEEATAEATEETAAPEGNDGSTEQAADLDTDDVLGLSNVKNGMKIYKMSTSFVNQKNCPYLMLDNLHLSRVGSGITGNALANFLITKVY